MWIKLEKANDWGYEFYCAKGEYKFSDRRNQRFEFNSTERIRWPNQKITFEAIGKKPFNNIISDHGHQQSVNGWIPVIKKGINGVQVYIEPDKVEIWRE